MVLIDYNAAKFERNDKSTDTVLLGTFGHAAPEQYGFGTSGPQADIYALGVLLNLMLCTKLPSEEIYSANRKIKKIIEKCTQMNPKDRYSNVSALKKELEKSTSLYISWLPPGFRSLKFYKMIIAVIGYVVIYGFSIENASGVEGVYSSRFDFVVTMCSCLSIVFFYCNYLGFRKICPFVNSKKAFIRVIGYIIDPIIIAISLIIVLCFICELFGMGTMIIME